MYKASVIISVYKDAQALRCIFLGLENQSERSFEVVVAEDGRDSAMSLLVGEYRRSFPNLIHHSQDDIGFRKTLAVNQAIKLATADYLIFLDGDCIPHKDFVRHHLEQAARGRVCTARRVHLGKEMSKEIRANPACVFKLYGWFGLLLLFFRLHADKVRNYEIGAPSVFFHWFAKWRHLSIVGCNFSCFKEDILKINGYDEALPGIGGEDCDLEWRFFGFNITTKNIKFLAITYHLFHDSRRQDADINVEMSRKNREQRKYFCEQGILKLPEKL